MNSQTNCKFCNSNNLNILYHVAECFNCGVLLYYPYPEDDEILYSNRRDIVKDNIGHDVILNSEPTNDNRSYDISSKKIKKILGFETIKTISDAVNDLKLAFKKGFLPNSLTDEKYFNGSNEDLIKVKKNTNLPVLRKDFIVDQYQIFESKIIGADCILLILSILDEIESSLFEQIALDIGLDVLIEVHNEKEMKRAEKMKSPLVGINNRNLSDFSVDINNSINVSRSMNSNKIPIAESGFHSRIDIDYVLKNSKIDTFLIGEALMKSSNLSQNIKNFIN